jgi:hypothetical protein
VTKVEPVTIDATEVKVGDDIVFLGQPHRVSQITEHDAPGWWPRFPGEGDCAFRMAHGAGDWTITLIPGERLEVLR